MSYGRRFFRGRRGSRDANHASIRDGLRALGHYVIDLAGCGDGVPDLCVYPRANWVQAGPRAQALAAFGVPVWLELKVGKGEFKPSQLRWRSVALNAGVRVATARTLDEAIEALQ